jgi:hypothetical protein
MRSLRSTALGWVAATALAATACLASDHHNLEEGLPISIEDAYVIGQWGREIQLATSYERTDEGDDRMVIDPRIEAGIARNWQAKIHAPFYAGSAGHQDSGNIGLEAFYTFNTETLALPAFALSGGAELPTGEDSAGVDTTAKFLVTRTITEHGMNRMHFNVSVHRDAGAPDDQRDYRYKAIVGFSRPWGPDTLLVADVLREEQREDDKESNVIEVGLRCQVTPRLVLTGGAGAGVGDESPDVVASLGLQRSF